MRPYRRWFRLRARTRRELEQEMADEIEAHMALRIEDLIGRGVDEARARALAVEQFGDRAVLMRTVVQREQRLNRWEWMENLKRDLTLAWRQVRKHPGTSALTLVTFAVGVGLTTALFTVVDRVLLRPLPYENPSELVALWGRAEAGGDVGRLSASDWIDLQRGSSTLAATAIYDDREYQLELDGRPRYVDGYVATAEFFDVLRVPMVQGRGFAASDEAAGAVVVSEGFWRTHLGARPLADATLTVSGRSFPVVGVIAQGAEFPTAESLWVLGSVPHTGGHSRNNINWNAIARLAPGVDRAAAAAELSAIAQGVQRSDPAALYMYGASVPDLRSTLTGDVRQPLLLLFGAVCMLLLIACTNVAGLTLARASRRAPEIATLLALGAGRGRVIRQLLTEQVALALAGGAAGIVVAWGMIGWMIRAAADRLPRVHEMQMDARILLFAFIVATVAGVLAGLWPALRASTITPHSLMTRRGVLVGGRRLPGAPFLIAEIALALTLLAAGGLLLRSLGNVLDRDLGFSAEGVAAASIVLGTDSYRADADASVRFWAALLDALRADPAVADAALANWLPTSSGGRTFLDVEGVGRVEDGPFYRVVSDDYFTTMRMPLLRGRSFLHTDPADGERVAVISESVARTHWPDSDPIGKRIRTPGMEGYENLPWLRIVGITSDVRHGGHEEEPAGHVYVLQRQRPDHAALDVLVRTRDGSAATAAAVMQRIVRDLDPGLAVEPRNLHAEVLALTSERRFITSVLTIFALLSLALAVTGIYGLLSFSVSQRFREIGVRAALGAGPRRIVHLIVSDVMRVVFLASAIGMLAAAAATRLLSTQLVDVSRADPVTWLTALAVIGLAALFAAAGPAFRASRVDPQTALRDG